MKRDPFELRYIPLSQSMRWDENPTRHDLEALIRSIERHGFGDPPKHDAQLDGLNAVPRALARWHTSLTEGWGGPDELSNLRLLYESRHSRETARIDGLADRWRIEGDM